MDLQSQVEQLVEEKKEIAIELVRRPSLVPRAGSAACPVRAMTSACDGDAAASHAGVAAHQPHCQDGSAEERAGEDGRPG